MNSLLHLCMAIGLVLCFQTVASQENPWNVKQLSDHIYQLRHDLPGYPVKVIVSVGDDGILMVDAGDRDHAEALKAKVQELWHGEPKVIILSHEHPEHIGGCETFGTTPDVYGHSSLRTVLKKRYYLFEEFTEATFPGVTVEDSLSIPFNGEEVRLVSVAGGHSGSDIIVWFTGSQVAFVQALCNWPHFPSIDNTTGDVNTYVEKVKQVVDLLPENTQIIPGHGEDCSRAEFRRFHDMLVQTSDIVKTEVAKGKTLEQLQQEDVLKEFKAFEGSYTSANDWIKYLVKGMEGRHVESGKSLYEAMYNELKVGGLDAAIAHYLMLKRDHENEYTFDETTLAIIGYMLFKHDKYPEAIGFMKLSLSEYPKGTYASLSYQVLGKCYEETNDIDLALENYRKLVELEPADSTTIAKIRELEQR